MEVTVVHRMDRRNGGDLASNPLRYLDVPHSTCDIQSRTVTHLAELRGIVILGGGALFGCYQPPYDWGKKVAAVLAPKSNKVVIVWGAGVGNEGKYPDGLQYACHIGVRDWDVGFPWVPCASVLHPGLIAAKRIKPSGEICAFESHVERLRLNLPTLTTRCAMHETIQHLCRYNIVVTNSYHGAYWMTLLGRRVVVIPRSGEREKFLHFKHPLVVASRKDWQVKVDDAKPSPEAFDECLAATRAFTKAALQVISLR